jgi:hypothetical protein
VEPASFVRVPPPFVCALGAAVCAAACLIAPEVRHTALAIVKIAWLYFVTGARG